MFPTGQTQHLLDDNYHVQLELLLAYELLHNISFINQSDHNENLGIFICADMFAKSLLAAQFIN